MFIQIYYSCFFTHFNNIFKYMVLCSICLQFFYFYYPVLFSPFILSESPLPAFLSIIIKAYSMGIFDCHTTNILIRWFYCVHWIKPPFHKFPINISHRHMKYLWNPSLTDLFFSVFFKTLSRQVFFSGSPLDWYYNSTGVFICQHYFWFLFVLIYFGSLF